MEQNDQQVTVQSTELAAADTVPRILARGQGRQQTKITRNKPEARPEQAADADKMDQFRSQCWKQIWIAKKTKNQRSVTQELMEEYRWDSRKAHQRCES